MRLNILSLITLINKFDHKEQKDSKDPIREDKMETSLDSDPPPILKIEASPQPNNRRTNPKVLRTKPRVAKNCTG